MNDTIDPIPRPPLTGHPRLLNRQMRRYRERSLDPRDLDSEPRGCNAAFQNALQGAGLAEAMGLEGVAELVHRAAIWGAALYDLVSGTQGTVTVQVGENRWTVPRIGPDAVASTQGWLDALGVALLARDAASIETLGRVEYQLVDEPGLQRPVHAGPTIRAFGAYAQSDDDTPKAVQAARAILTESHGSIMSVWGLRVGPLEMLSALLDDDPARFQGATVQALQWYRDYIVEDEWAHAHDKFLPWLLLGLAARAYDRGWTVEVNAEYYPQWLVAGQPQPT